MARIQSVQIGSFPEYSGQSIGGPRYPVFSTVVNDTPGQTNPNNNAQLGDILVDKFGGAYAYVRTVAGLTVGQAVKYAANLTGTVTAAGSTTGLVNSNITTTIREDGVGSFLSCPGTTAFTKLIIGQSAVGANTGFTVAKTDIFFGIGKTDGDALAAVPTNGDVLHVVRPYAVDVAGAGDTPCGVALGTVTSGNRTLVQVSGLAQVSAIGSTDALTDNGIAVTAASGKVKGTLGTATAASAIQEAKSIVGIAKMAYAGASQLIPVFLWDLLGRY